MVIQFFIRSPLGTFIAYLIRRLMISQNTHLENCLVLFSFRKFWMKRLWTMVLIMSFEALYVFCTRLFHRFYLCSFWIFVILYPMKACLGGLAALCCCLVLWTYGFGDSLVYCFLVLISTHLKVNIM